MNRSELAAFIDSTPFNWNDTRYRPIPTEFDAESPLLRALPRARTTRWESCESYLEEIHSCGVVTRLPAFWQSVFTLFESTRALKIPIFSVDPQNIPLCAVSCQETNIDTIITERCGAGDVLDFCVARSLSAPRVWLLIESVETQWFVPETIRSFEHRTEVHLFPGVPILEQCRRISRNGSLIFHRSERADWKEDGTGLSVTFKDASPGLPSLDLSFTMRSVGTCECGKETYERI